MRKCIKCDVVNKNLFMDFHSLTMIQAHNQQRIQNCNVYIRLFDHSFFFTIVSVPIEMNIIIHLNIVITWINSNKILIIINFSFRGICHFTHWMSFFTFEYRSFSFFFFSFCLLLIWIELSRNGCINRIECTGYTKSMQLNHVVILQCTLFTLR